MWKRKDADEVIFLLLNLQKKISRDKHFCFRFGTILIIFSFKDENLEDSKKKHLTKKKKKEIEKQLLDLMIIDEVVKAWRFKQRSRRNTRS